MEKKCDYMRGALGIDTNPLALQCITGCGLKKKVKMGRKVSTPAGTPGVLLKITRMNPNLD
jgi:hypothetical protein